MKKSIAVALLSLISSLNVASADSGVIVSSMMSEVRVASYGQIEWGETQPNVVAEVLSATSGKEDQLIVKLGVTPYDCNVGFAFKTEVAQYIEDVEGARIYRFFDTIPLNGPASICPGSTPRTLTVAIRGRLFENHIRFIQMNRKYTEVSYVGVKDNGVIRITNLKVENDK